MFRWNCWTTGVTVPIWALTVTLDLQLTPWLHRETEPNGDDVQLIDRKDEKRSEVVEGFDKIEGEKRIDEVVIAVIRIVGEVKKFN